MPNDFAGRFHFGAEQDVGAAEFREGEDGFLERVVGGDDFLREVDFGIGQLLPGHDHGGVLGERAADGLADEGDGARGARVDFEDVDDLVLDGELDVHQAADVEGLGHLEGGFADFVLALFWRAWARG